MAGAKEYKNMPTLDQWLKDSSVALARRKDDIILTRIDALLREYGPHRSAYAKIQLHSDLFFTLDYWLKVHGNTPGMDKSRRPVIYELYKYTADSLAEALSCKINTLPEHLERHFGRKLSYHGEHLDLVGQFATYLTRAEVAKYRLSFRNGKAYMWMWPGKGHELTRPTPDGGLVTQEKKQPKGMKLVLAESESASNKNVFGLKQWGGFAMSMGRDLYMARHHCGEGSAGPGSGGNFYHSSYLGGDPVLCAGTILIEQGMIKAVCNDSGHYQPDEANFMSFLQTLMMHGVNVQGIQIYDYARRHCVSGRDFIQNRGNWARALLLGQQTAYVANDTAAQKYVSEKIEHKKRVAALWKQAVDGHIVANTIEGRQFFAEKLLRNYTGRDGKSPYAYDVNTTWILEVITTFYGPVPANPLPQGKPPVPARRANGRPAPPPPRNRPAPQVPPRQKGPPLPPRPGQPRVPPRGRTP
ncbi:hypothetical protein [Bosea sp. (in: a-proteobacteria)]|uniref:hypothetical protein n=1 Tax=Bosea sp. (in: a-proteobacteria) TaxID=1871050 RepID=UPI002736161B|nr:hypothetical protein [Bosea sp. (in: a-proteobacteria)]MDP3407215.1 hypothetical protein [Bosea sp. (in: a-proteobacteria)]